MVFEVVVGGCLVLFFQASAKIQHHGGHGRIKLCKLGERKKGMKRSLGQVID